MKAKDNVRKKKQYTCGNCGWTVKEEDRFCPHCGSSFVDDEKEDEELEYKCNECGGIVNKEDRFCSHCGEPFDEDDEDEENEDKSYHYIGVQFESKIYPGTFYGNIYTYKTKTTFKYNQVIYVPTRLGLRKARVVEEKKNPDTIYYDLDDIMVINNGIKPSNEENFGIKDKEETLEKLAMGSLIIDGELIQLMKLITIH